MNFHLGILLSAVIQHGDIGDDQRIRTDSYGAIDSLLPPGFGRGMGKGVDGNMQFATMLVNIVDATRQLLIIKIQSSKMAGIGVILEADIDGIGSMIDGGF